MAYLCISVFKVLILCAFCMRGLQLQMADFPITLEHNDLLALMEDDLDLTQVNWRVMTPLLLKRQQLRLCVALYRYDQSLLAGTACEQLMDNGLMAFCDIGHIEDLSVTMRDAFGGMLFDTLQKCRPGLEIFGVRCRRRA